MNKELKNMRQLEISFSECQLPPSDHTVEQTFLTVKDIEDGVYNAKNYADYSDDDGTDEDDFDEQCRLTFEADSNFEQDIIDEKNEINEEEVKDVSE